MEGRLGVVKKDEDGKHVLEGVRMVKKGGGGGWEGR